MPCIVSAMIAFALLLAGRPAYAADVPATTDSAVGKAPSASAANSAKDPSTDPAEDDRRNRLSEARKRIDDGKPREAITLIEGVIADYEKQYPDTGETRWYVAQTMEETAEYQALTITRADVGKGAYANAHALNVAWAEAYFLKAFALVELSVGSGAYKINKPGNTPANNPEPLLQALATLERGLRLAPYNTHLLSERGNIQQLQHEWTGMLQTFAEIESVLARSPDPDRKILGRAKRGIGYALVELGRLDEAEAKYRECLQIDPDDAIAKDELDYIRRRRAEK